MIVDMVNVEGKELTALSPKSAESSPPPVCSLVDGLFLDDSGCENIEILELQVLRNGAVLPSQSSRAQTTD